MLAADLFLDGLPGTDGFEIEDEIGHGAFSEVYRARSRATSELVALKHMCFGEDGQRPLHVVREIDALMALQNHPHIVQFLGLAEARFSISLVLQYCDTDLYTVLSKAAGTAPPLAVAKTIFQQLLQALSAVHAAGLAHRDVSPGNILFDHAGNLRLSDFGQARRVRSPHSDAEGHSLPTDGSTPTPPPLLTPAVGTRWYRAPELLFGSRNYCTSVDVWSAGCIFAELLTGKPLFPGSSDIDQLCRVRDVLGSPSTEAWSRFSDLPDWGKLIFPPLAAKSWEEALPGVDHAALGLLGGMLCYDPAARLTAEQALRHEFFMQAPLPAAPQTVIEELKKLQAGPRS